MSLGPEIVMYSAKAALIVAGITTAYRGGAKSVMKPMVKPIEITDSFGLTHFYPAVEECGEVQVIFSFILMTIAIML